MYLLLVACSGADPTDSATDSSPATAADDTATHDTDDTDDTDTHDTAGDDTDTAPDDTDTDGDDTGGPLDWGVTFGDEGAVLRGTFNWGNAGTSLAGVGDVDADGYNDLVVGADHEGISADGSGAAYVVSGARLSGDVDLPDVGLQLAGDGFYSGAGMDVGGGEDVDGDGLPDVVVMGAQSRNDPKDSGVAYVFTGVTTSVGAGSVNDARITARCGDSTWGSVATGADVDGDGLGDLILGCPGDMLAAVFTAPTGNFTEVDAFATFTTPDSDYRLGDTVRPAGDVDGDGLGDWVVGGYDYTEVVGKAWLVPGSLTGSNVLDDVAATLEGESVDDAAGVSASSLGDLDGDGFDEVGIGAPLGDRGGVDGGVVYVVPGGATATTIGLSLSAATTIIEGRRGDHLGIALAHADVDGNGDTDLLLGGNGRSGVVRLFLGPVPAGVLDASADELHVYGQYEGDNAGMALTNLGDLNGDGTDEVAVGAPDHGEGVVYILFGGS